MMPCVQSQRVPPLTDSRTLTEPAPLRRLDSRREAALSSRIDLGSSLCDKVAGGFLSDLGRGAIGPGRHRCHGRETFGQADLGLLLLGESTALLRAILEVLSICMLA